jgi:glycosyltransferase involved in cell wall biosynthesis
MKVFVLDAKENWVCDRFAMEWTEHNRELSTSALGEADVVWALAGWRWNHLPLEMLKNKKLVVTIHHIVPDKFDELKLQQFMIRDQFVDAYHVPCEKTKSQIQELTSKEIFVAPFWANPRLWFEISSKTALREKFAIDESCYLIGSFQRDTEGHDLITPKLEKGPDLFCDRVISMARDIDNVKVLLAGWRRQYVMHRLTEAEVPFYYFELPGFDVLNELYNCLDLYLVTARHEGGPQSIIECALSKTPIISTDVGCATAILSPDSIIGYSNPAVPNVKHAYNSVQHLNIPRGFEPFVNFFEELCNG